MLLLTIIFGGLLMMGRHTRGESLFYYFRSKIRFQKIICCD